MHPFARRSDDRQRVCSGRVYSRSRRRVRVVLRSYVAQVAGLWHKHGREGPLLAWPPKPRAAGRPVPEIYRRWLQTALATNVQLAMQARFSDDGCRAPSDGDDPGARTMGWIHCIASWPSNVQRPRAACTAVQNHAAPALQGGRQWQHWWHWQWQWQAKLHWLQLLHATAIFADWLAGNISSHLISPRPRLQQACMHRPVSIQVDDACLPRALLVESLDGS
jgi:hypothetical protein